MMMMKKWNYQANPARVVYLSMRFVIKMFKQDFALPVRGLKLIVSILLPNQLNLQQ